MTTRAPLIAGIVIGTAGLAWTAVIGTSDGHFARSAAFAIAVGLLFFTILSVTGILLVRAPWARWLATATLAVGVLTGAVIGLDPVGWIAVGCSLVAIAVLVGPWLDVWLRGRPTPDAVGWQPPVLALAAVGLTPLVGYASPIGLEPIHGVLAGLGLLFGWAFSRAELWGLWGLRLTIAPLVVLAALATETPGNILLVIAGVAITALAWSPRVRSALGSPAPVLPAPRPTKGSR